LGLRGKREGDGEGGGVDGEGGVWGSGSKRRREEGGGERSRRRRSEEEEGRRREGYSCWP